LFLLLTGTVYDHRAIAASIGLTSSTARKSGVSGGAGPEIEILLSSALPDAGRSAARAHQQQSDGPEAIVPVPAASLRLSAQRGRLLGVHGAPAHEIGLQSRHVTGGEGSQIAKQRLKAAPAPISRRIVAVGICRFPMSPNHHADPLADSSDLLSRRAGLPESSRAELGPPAESIRA
jgi:hypothetical protein